MKVIEQVRRGIDDKVSMVLATLIRRTGSAPPPLGSRFLVKADGSTAGSIGGGCLEAEIWQDAMEMMGRTELRRRIFSLSGDLAEEEGLVCGGTVDVLMEPISWERKHRTEVICRLHSILDEGRSAVVATILPSVDGTIPVDDPLTFMLIEDGEEVGRIPPGLDRGAFVKAMKDAMTTGRLDIIKLDSTDDGEEQKEILIEPVSSAPMVFIFGGGHVSLPLESFARTVGFRTVVIDDREPFANTERFPLASETVVTDLTTIVPSLPIAPSSFIVIVTRGHRHDLVVLEQALGTSARYIGMIGSRRKIHLTYEELTKRGIPRERLEEVHAPIGLDIGSKTPEEIALSVVAEMTAVRRGHKGKRDAPSMSR